MSQKITQVHNVSPQELTSQIVQTVQLITSQKEKYLENKINIIDNERFFFLFKI